MKPARSNSKAHHSTVELSNCQLELRSDLTFHFQEFQGAPCYLIEDEFNSRFYRIGLAEYHLISQMDGHTKIGQATAKTAAALGDQAISDQNAITICKWLIDTQLATTEASRTANRMLVTSEKSEAKQRLAKLNPISPKISLFNPDSALTQLAGLTGWVFSKVAMTIWLVVVAFAAFQAWSHWDRLASSNAVVLARDNWIWLGLTWLGLKLVHETAHGVACKVFGGTVRQCGLVLILLVPLPFVDVTSSWRFQNKWQRIFVAAAGMYAELFLAAAATVVWTYSDGLVRQHAFNVMLTGSLTTVFFNANPLMRFDGYYMLADWLELPNLGSHGQQWIRWVGRKFYLGIEAAQPSWPEGRGLVVATYAVLALLWKILICVAMAIAAESLFFGMGVGLAALAVVTWLIWPLLKLLKLVFIGDPLQPQPSRIRFALLTAGLASLGWLVCTQVPWYARVHAAAVVDVSQRQEVRTPVAGFLKEILVEPGQTVEAGEVVARLENLDVLAEIEKLQIDLQASDLRVRQFRQQGRIPAINIELKNREALEDRLAERTSQRDSLDVRAGAAGVVVAEELKSQLGVYFPPGHRLCTIESPARKEIRALVSQHDLELFQGRLQKPVDVHVWGTGATSFPAKLNELNPRGRVELPHPAFAASAGGVLPVRYRSPESSKDTLVRGNANLTDAEEASPVELVAPHFLARVELSPTASERLRSGQTATVSFRASRGSVGDVLSEKITLWIRNLREMSRSAW